MQDNEINSVETVTKSNNNPKIFGGIIVLILLVILIPKLFNSAKSTTPVAMNESTNSPTTSPKVESTTPVDVVNGAISVEAGSFYYKPNLIRIKKGEKIKLTLNSVSMMHDFNIDELGVKVPIIKSENSATVEFTADKVGEFEFYCSVGQHRQNGQVGKLIVTE